MNSSNFIINLYISIWSAFAYTYVDKIPRPKYTLEHPYATFVKYHKNEINVPYPKTTLLRFNQALDNLIHNRQRKVNIVHFGDSHVQADFFSDQVRQHFNDEKLLGNGGRGYFFPCSMAQSQDPYNLKVNYLGRWNGCKNISLNKSCSWGLSGMVSTTNDSTAQFTIDPNTRSPHKYQISKARVYYHVNNPQSYFVKMVTPEGDIWPSRLDAEGYAEFTLKNPTDKVSFKIEKLFAQQNYFTLEGVALENDQAGVQYHAVGVNGATVASFLKTPKLENHLKSLSPDLVIISLGTNDAYGLGFSANDFKVQLAKLIQRIKSAQPDVSILLTTPADCGLPGGRPNPSNQAAVKVMYEIAEETDIAIWNLYEIMGGFGSVNHWLKQGLSAFDRVHFTAKGYRLQGDLLYDALIQSYADYSLQKNTLSTSSK
jgi:lysophospholipase L1-like esterase